MKIEQLKQLNQRQGRLGLARLVPRESINTAAK